MFWIVAGAVVCGSIFQTATAQVDSSAVPEPSVFEVIAKQRNTKVISSEEVGRIESSDARAVITALIVENSYYTPSRVRGIRIDLRNVTSSDHIFVEESELVYLKQDLDRMNCDVPRMRNESGTAYRVRGIARCRPSRTVPQAYCPGYYVEPESEGLSLSTFAGGKFRFPSKKPSSLADTIGRAMNELGIDDKIPKRELITVHPDDRRQIFESAVSHFPELASSPGIKAADYMSREDTNSAWVIFWPHERAGDYAHALSVTCNAVGDGDKRTWDCNDSMPRGYLSVAEQDREVVITGAAEREQIMALIEFAKRHLRDDPNYTEIDKWMILQIIAVPDSNSFFISWTGGANGGVRIQVNELATQAEERFEIVDVIGYDQQRCD